MFVCLLDHISVVTSSLTLNLISLESLFISLSIDVPFVGILHLGDDQHNSDLGEGPWKMCHICLPLKSSLFVCWY